MSKTRFIKPKYVAEGFCKDASKLLNSFLDISSVQFADFAKAWRKHHFSLIFMGRPEKTELTEFTNEMFKITTDFWSSPSFYMKVGSVYLLYSLFRVQLSTPAIRIRLEMSHWEIIKSLRIEAISKEYRSLHYIIDYLIKNAFIYVTHQKLMGPHTNCNNLPSVSKNSDVIASLKANYKSDTIEYSVSNNLQKLQDLQNEYLEVKNTLGDSMKLQLNKAGPSYEKYIQELQNLVGPPLKAAVKVENVGSRRTRIKAKAFGKRTITRYGNITNEISDNPPKSSARSGPKKKGIRLPAAERRVGRPPKNPKPVELPEPESEDDDIDISHLLSQQQEFYLPPVETEYKKCRTKRERYYKESPKREDDNSSDIDIPV